MNVFIELLDRPKLKGLGKPFIGYVCWAIRLPNNIDVKALSVARVSQFKLTVIHRTFLALSNLVVQWWQPQVSGSSS